MIYTPADFIDAAPNLKCFSYRKYAMSKAFLIN